MQVNIAVLMISCFLILSFAYSVIEKVAAWKKTKEFYQIHFQNSFLKNYIPVSLVFVVVLECLSIGLSLLGIYRLVMYHESKILLFGLSSMALTLIVLMTGQRIAQDYSGAMNITVYFILTVFGIYIL